jgi:hypothetical protein
VVTVTDPLSISVDVEGNQSMITSEISDTSATVRVSGQTTRVVATSNTSASIRIRGRTCALLNKGILLLNLI